MVRAVAQRDGDMMRRWATVEGSPSPLGVTWIADEQAYNFALFARHALGVTLLLYAKHDLVTPAYQKRPEYLKNKSSRVWHCRVSAAEANGAVYYAYRVEGANERVGGGRFDPQKILLDPYASAVYFPPTF